MKSLHIITFILIVVGGLNWLVYGIWGVDVGSLVGGMTSTAARAIYVLVGIATVIEILSHKKCCTCCSAPTSQM